MTIPAEEMLWRIALAIAFGLVLGLDREMRTLSAGIRPYMLVALGSALTVLVATELQARMAAHGGSPPDPTRVIHALAISVGILCSGVVFFSKGTVHGLTAAAGLWMTSSVGVAVGAGLYSIAVAGLLFAVLILSVPWVVSRCLPGGTP
jgi:putative Mg2+ transporter-C (MgtC) family protein